MRVAVIVTGLALCAWATASQVPAWHDDRALWSAAVAVTDLPRPAINLAVVALKQGDVGRGLAWDTDALARSTRHPETAGLVHRLVRHHIQWILLTSTSTDICDGQPWASWCVSP